MYGNYFENVEDSVECMLLPKIMSMNSQNFHFTACNFTERNMYLRLEYFTLLYHSYSVIILVSL